jgi:Uma2 family endonuclease
MMTARAIMSEKPRRPATYADLEALPPHQVGEIIAGALYASPRPAMPHTRAASRLGMALGPFDSGSGGPGGWIILDEPELHLGGDVLVPDVAGWQRERMPKLPRVPALTIAPDWVCEVISPSTEKRDRSAKLPAYAREGVRHVWLVDPDLRTLEIFRLEGPRYVLLGTHTDEASVRAEPFDAIELSLRVLWEE